MTNAKIGAILSELIFLVIESKNDMRHFVKKAKRECLFFCWEILCVFDVLIFSLFQRAWDLLLQEFGQILTL